MDVQQQIERFLDGAPHAVAGASRDRRKYGNKVLRAYLQSQRPVFPVNPNVASVEGLEAYSHLADLPEEIHGLSIVTPPHFTEEIIQQAVERKIEHVWMQPGAESETAIEHARAHGINCIANGPCLLVALRFQELQD